MLPSFLVCIERECARLNNVICLETNDNFEKCHDQLSSGKKKALWLYSQYVYIGKVVEV